MNEYHIQHGVFSITIQTMGWAWAVIAVRANNISIYIVNPKFSIVRNLENFCMLIVYCKFNKIIVQK
jgi:hypothetical protein